MVVSSDTPLIGTQVTSVALTQGAPSVCIEPAGVEGGVVTALATGTGRPLANRVRTTVLSGFTSNTIDCERHFDPQAANGSGVLHLPGPGDRTVSVAPAFSSEELVPVADGDALVPAAADLSHVKRRLSTMGRCGGRTMAFPLGGDGSTWSNSRSGEVPDQAVTFDDTVGSRVGNDALAPAQETPDGFLLRGDCTSLSSCQVAVFVAELGPEGCRLGISAAVAGFSVTSSLETVATEAAMRTSASPGCNTIASEDE